MKYWDKIEQLAFKSKIVFNPAGIHPCTLDEVRELEKSVGLQLPEAYREFLLWAGHGLGSFMTGSRFLYEDLRYIQPIGNEMLEENGSPDRLPEDAFIFWMHGGYIFSFFRTSEGDNPPVHNYYEDKNDNRIRWNYEESFVTFVRDEIVDQATHYARATGIENQLERGWQNTAS